MIRRRRPVREVAFGFDSFLDIVANVVGIIIRLILVVWVGARSYTAMQMPPKPPDPPPDLPTPVSPPPLTDPLQPLLAEQKQKLTQAQARLLEQLRKLDRVQIRQTQAGQELTSLSQRRQQLEKDLAALDQAKGEKEQNARSVILSLTDLQARHQKLAEEIRALEKQPAAKKVLTYRMPVSQPVNSEEYLFELSGGRVAFADVPAMLDEIRRTLREKEESLRNRWLVTDVTPSVGDFRLRYTIERRRGLADVLGNAPTPGGDGNFGYGLSEWQLEPMAAIRGETAAEALADGSEFRHIVDGMDAAQSVVTLWVYPDSFALYRQLRDYLHERGVVVAGRPLPTGVPIMCSRRGTRSRGQ